MNEQVELAADRARRMAAARRGLDVLARAYRDLRLEVAAAVDEITSGRPAAARVRLEVALHRASVESGE